MERCAQVLPKNLQMWQDSAMPGGTKKPAGLFVEAVAGILRGQIGTENLTHQQIADSVGISRAQVSKILAGHKQIDMQLLDEICWAIGLPLRELILKADEKTEWRHVDPAWETPTLVRH